MKKNSREDIIKKWAPILENIGLTGSKADCLSEYAELNSKQEIENSKPDTHKKTRRSGKKHKKKKNGSL